MAVKVADWVSIALSIFLLLFQMAMIHFIVQMRASKSPTYLTTCFTLLLLSFVVDTPPILINFFALQLHMFDAVKPYYLDSVWLPSSIYILSSFFVYSQYFFHLAIAVNRFWIIGNSIRRISAVPKALVKACKKIYLLIPVVSLLLVARRFFGHAIYVKKPDGEITLKYPDPGVQQYLGMVATLLPATTGVIAFLFELTTVVKYRNLVNSGAYIDKKLKRDVRLLAQACVLLLLQLSLAGIQIIVFVGSSMSQSSLTQIGFLIFLWCNTAFNGVGPVVLIIVSKYVRKDFVDFYTRSGPKENKVVSVSSIAAVEPGNEWRTTDKDEFYVQVF